jgi:voltage-gated potassium channel
MAQRESTALLRLKRKLHRLVFEADTPLGILFETVIISLILLSVITTVLSSYPEVERRYGRLFHLCEWIVVAVFTMEYVLRLWICDAGEDWRERKAGRRRSPWRRMRTRISYFFTPLAQIDLWAVLPFYIGFCDLRFLRLLRIFRLFRIFKLARYSRSLDTLLNYFRERARLFLIVLLMVITALLINATALYIAERESNPETFGTIPKTLWWCFLRLGQAEPSHVAPVTEWGKFFTALMIIGFRVGMICVFGGIFAAAFIEKFFHRSSRACPNADCGLKGIVSEADFCPLCGTKLGGRGLCCADNPAWAVYCRFCGRNLRGRTGKGIGEPNRKAEPIRDGDAKEGVESKEEDLNNENLKGGERRKTPLDEAKRNEEASR